MNNIGIYGLGTMGLSLARNFSRHGFSVSAYNREPDVLETLNDKKIVGYQSIIDFVNSLEHPRTILLMITAGDPVDQVISTLEPLLNEGDVLIDGGNSHYKDSNRRHDQLKMIGIHYVSLGVSGGEKGALNGPSLMPSCSKDVYTIVKPFLEAIAARDKNGTICCKRLGDKGAGHFIKTVHNGIEYAEMQLIADTYQLLRNASSVTDDDILNFFLSLNVGDLKSFLLDITVDILSEKDSNGKLVLNRIEDIARQNGTGKWTIESALEVGSSATILYSALSSRIVSEEKINRVALSRLYKESQEPFDLSKENLEALKTTVFCTRIMIYEQGLNIIKKVSTKEGWNINLMDVLSVWKAGCILESNLMDILSDHVTPDDSSVLLKDNYFSKVIINGLKSWRYIASLITVNGIYAPTITEALSTFEGMSTNQSSATIIQAMRHRFGAHPLIMYDLEKDLIASDEK